MTANFKDIFRQVLNVVAAFSQVAVTFLTYALGTDKAFDSQDNGQTTPIVPAGYTFAIWGLIYGSSLVYAVHQALPRQRENELLRRIGFNTTAAYAGTSLWLVTAQNRLYWLTVAVFFGILVALLGAFVQFIRYGAPRTNAERFLVVLPVSVYAGWATVATIANTSTALAVTGFSGLGLSDQTWAIIMLIVATVVGSVMVFKSRGNLWYALTVVWALVGIVVANLTWEANSYVAVTAGAGAVVAAIVWLVTILNHRQRALF